MKEDKKNTIISNQNIEKWGLFTTTKDNKERVLTRVDENGNVQTVEIRSITDAKGEKHTLTAREGKLLYFLCHLWEKSGRPDKTPVYFNFRQIAKVGKMSWNQTQVKHLKTAIINLKTVPILYINSFRSSKNGEIIKMTEPMTILSHLKLFERYKRGKDEPYFEFSEFQFHPYILESLKNGYFKSLRLDVIAELRSEIAFLLYRWLDLVMAQTESLEKVIDKKLAEDIGLIHMRIDNLLAQIRKACKELEGKEITTGKIVYCRVEKTVDGRSWKLVVRKGKQEQHELPEPKEQPTDEATQLVNIFLKSFNHDRNPVAKELEQAKDLIDRLGFKKAEFVVEFGIHRVKNDFSGVPQWFGAIILYEKEALEEIERQERELKQQQELSAKIKREEEQKLKNKKVSVFLEYTSFDQVKEVKVAGSFNNWQPEPMARVGNKWSILLELEPGEYQYKFIVDGQWLCDPKNPNKVCDNNNENSLLSVLP